MISTAEQFYCETLIRTCRNAGYEYYVLREVYNDDNCDVELYVSESEITLHSDDSWTVDAGLLYRIDSSTSYNYSSYRGDVVSVSEFNGSVTANSYEAVFSNVGNDIILVPDILAEEVKQNETVQNMGFAVVLCLCVIGFTALFSRLFRS